MKNLYLKQFQVENYQIANKKSFVHISATELNVDQDENVHLINEHNQHVGNMRCVGIEEINFDDLSDSICYLFNDFPKKYLRHYMRGLGKTVWVYYFSSNAFYHNYYDQYVEKGVEYRQTELFNANIN